MKTTNFSNYNVSKVTLGKSNKDFFFRTTNVTKGLQSLADVTFLVFTEQDFIFKMYVTAHPYTLFLRSSEFNILFSI